jgi:hypothetical protein
MEGKGRWLTAANKSCDLLSSHLIGVLGRVHPLNVNGSSPTIASEAELGDPLICPTSDDRLASRMAGGVIVETAIGTCFGIASSPHTHINSVNRRNTIDLCIRCMTCLRSQQGTQPINVNAAMSKSSIKTAPAPTVDRLHTQMYRRREWTGSENGIGQFKEGILSLGEAGVEI